jgi:site-specific DNA recombinase
VTASPVSLPSVKSGAGSPSLTIAPTPCKRAIGVVRVSRVGDRDGERFVSPSEQAERIAAACERDGLDLLDTIEELDVSGGATLARRHGLRRAVEMIEAGEADVLVAAYFDRLVRSLRVQDELVSRVEAAGGQVLAVDVGQVTNGSAGQWLSGTMLGAVAEYARRVTAERTSDAKRRAVERGVPPFPNVPPGYRRGEGSRLEPDPDTAAAVAEAFRLRANGATVMEVREHLREHGVDRSFHGVQALLGSRIVLGELRFGSIVNLEAHPAIVDAATWAAVQRMRSPRGRRAKSDRLLARLGVLRCGTCGGRMVVGSSNHGTYPLYRCSPVSDCPRRVTVSADMAESVVVGAVQELLEGMRGTATVADGAEHAERDLERAEHDLDAAVRAFTGLEDVDAARERLTALRETRDAARDRLAELRAASAPAVTVTATGDWHLLTLDEQRALIAAVVDRAVVAPGRGRGRITVEPRGK